MPKFSNYSPFLWRYTHRCGVYRYFLFRIKQQCMLETMSRDGRVVTVFCHRQYTHSYGVYFITFRVSRIRREMFCGHARLCVCLSAAACPHYCTDPDVTSTAVN